MTANEIKAHIYDWATERERIDNILKPFEELSGTLADSPLVDVMDLVFSAYTRTLAELLGDDEIGHLDWFWLENDMGKAEHEAGYDDDIRPIKTLDDLVWLIEEGNKQ